ncbi:hypothetical protein LPU83_pLPU83d_0004 (plasmid) [Rhizobium favelukesii]|uniref:Uncharacterized protein n=1 Tax=Rhizobium favelukesii TaxID=348824 RepID=W6RMB8_9HYPH|nr:hypothetical protein LPU83_pLPU83d_0004 [Rhizobium favelukesii]
MDADKVFKALGDQHAESCLTFYVKGTGRRLASFAKIWTWPGNPLRSTSRYWRRPIW